MKYQTLVQLYMGCTVVLLVFYSLLMGLPYLYHSFALCIALLNIGITFGAPTNTKACNKFHSKLAGYTHVSEVRLHHYNNLKKAYSNALKAHIAGIMVFFATLPGFELLFPIMGTIACWYYWRAFRRIMYPEVYAAEDIVTRCKNLKLSKYESDSVRKLLVTVRTKPSQLRYWMHKLSKNENAQFLKWLEDMMDVLPVSPSNNKRKMRGDEVVPFINAMYTLWCAKVGR